MEELKRYTITRFTASKRHVVDAGVDLFGPEGMKVSDGFHTMDELYEHRIELFIALCRICRRHELIIGEVPEQPFVWRSKLHDDGSSFDGWFILGIGSFKGQQITYHLPISKWEETDFAQTLEKSPKWDKHTSADVLTRLKTL